MHALILYMDSSISYSVIMVSRESWTKGGKGGGGRREQGDKEEGEEGHWKEGRRGRKVTGGKGEVLILRCMSYPPNQ